MRAASRPPSPTLPHKGEGSPLWTPLLIAIAIALVAWLALVPLGFMLWQSVLSPETAASAAQFTLDNYRTAYASADTARLLANSLEFALGSAVLAFSLGTLLAWINDRTDTPFKTPFFALTLVPLIMPGILFTVSWIFLGSPKIGIVNLVLQRVFATDTVFINIYSIPGMIWVDGLHYSPMAFLLMTAAFRAMDPALEEPAMMRRATLPRCGAADPCRAAAGIVGGAGAARPAGRHRGLYVGDLRRDPRLSERNRPRLRLRRGAACHHLAVRFPQPAHRWPRQPLCHGDRQGLSSARHAHRPLALRHGGGFPDLRFAGGRAAIPGAAMVVAAAFLQRANCCRAQKPDTRFLSHRARLSGDRHRGLEQHRAGTRQRHADHAGDVDFVLDRGAHQTARARAPRQSRLAAAGVSRPGARAGDHGLLPGAADRRLRHDLDHADRLCDAVYALRHALQRRLVAAGAQGTRGIRRHERGVARHHVRPHRAAAVETGPDRRLDLHRHRLDPGTGQLHFAL